MKQLKYSLLVMLFSFVGQSNAMEQEKLSVKEETTTPSLIEATTHQDGSYWDCLPGTDPRATLTVLGIIKKTHEPQQTEPNRTRYNSSECVP